MLARHGRTTGRLACVMAWVALPVGQLHALARYRTTDGRADLELPLTAAWAEPADRLLSPLLDWASADVVYLTYGKAWLPIFVAFTLCAFAVRARRQPTGVERWAWRVALTGYVLACLSVAAEYWTQWGAVDERLLETVFLAAVPAMLLTMLGSSFLGVVLLRRGAPRLPAVLLVLAVPAMVVVPMVTSLGNVVLPIVFAFGLLDRRLAEDAAGAEVGPARARSADGALSSAG